MAPLTTPRRAALAGLLVALAAFFVYWLSDRAYDAGRGDLFYLADAFLHGRTWIDVALGPLDVIYRTTTCMSRSGHSRRSR